VKEIAIVGVGVVGRAYARVFPPNVLQTHDLRDEQWTGNWCGGPEGNEKTHKQTQRARTDQCRLAIVCVPTPPLEGGGCDISAVEDVIAWLKTPLILIKSAVPPGTTDHLSHKYKKDIAVSPEYIGESKYHVPDEFLHPSDPRKHPFQIFGGEKHVTSQIVAIFEKYLGPTKKYIQTEAATAELVKYMENCFFATKVTFCNEFANIARHMDVDYRELRELFVLDPRVGPMHTSVFEDNPGFAGKCFPKDLAAVIAAAEDAGYDPQFLRAVVSNNHKFGGEVVYPQPEAPESLTKAPD